RCGSGVGSSGLTSSKPSEAGNLRASRALQASRAGARERRPLDYMTNEKGFHLNLARGRRDILDATGASSPCWRRTSRKMLDSEVPLLLMHWARAGSPCHGGGYAICFNRCAPAARRMPGRRYSLATVSQLILLARSKPRVM